MLDSIVPALKAFADTYDFFGKLKTKNTGSSPVLKFIKEVQEELHSLVPVDFPEIYSFDRMKELPRYCKALALRAQRGSLNLASAEKKMQEVMIYSERLLQILVEENTNILPNQRLSGDHPLLLRDTSKPEPARRMPGGNPVVFRELRDCFAHCNHLQRQTKIEELFWMIEEYKVSLFAQELKTPYPVSPKKINQLIKEIELL